MRSRLLLDLWNGGLDPATAEPGALRDRRILAGTAALALPLFGALMISNLFTGAAQDNGVIAVMGVLVALSPLLQAWAGRPRLAGQFLVGVSLSGWVAASLDVGLGGTGWAWSLVLPPVATLLTGRVSGLVWTGITILTLWGFVALHVWGGLPFLNAAIAQTPTQVAVEAALMHGMLLATTQVFVSGRDAVEAELHRSIDALARQIEERRRAEQAARAAEDAKGAFLAAMSHELRTPLNGVLGGVQLLRQRPLDAESEELVRVMAEGGEHLLELIGDVLELSRLGEGAVRLEPVPLALAPLLRATLAPLELQARTRGLTLRLHVDPDVPTHVRADAARLRQILVNLVGNAVKFTERGGVEVSVSRLPAPEAGPPDRPDDPDEIAEGTVAAAPVLRFEVTDTGVGIEPERLAVLFEPYVQADASVADRYGGAGLGLAIARSLARAMGGDLHAVSAPGEGASFRADLSLPEAPAPEGADGHRDAGPGNPVPRPEASRRVLVVDDNPVNRMIVTRMLVRLGHEPFEAEDGAIALEQVLALAPDLVLMDLSMPRVDGFEALSRLAALAPPARDVPVVALTAHALADDRRRVLAAGARGFLTKPVRLAELAAALQAHARSPESPVALAEDRGVPDTPAVVGAEGVATAPSPHTRGDRA